MKGKQVQSAVTGTGSSITVANLPSKSALYQQQLIIKHEDIQWYTLNWARLETYLLDLKERNPELTVRLEKDEDNRFWRMFIGYTPNIGVLRNAGLDVYALDSCHVKHLVAKGMQLHILAASQGANRNLLVAFSLDRTESAESYQFFGLMCQSMGLMDLFGIDRNFVPSIMV